MTRSRVGALGLAAAAVLLGALGSAATGTSAAGSQAGRAVTATRQAAHLTVSPTGGPPGTVLTVRGSGFTRGSAITVSFDGVPRAAGTAGSAGSFQITFAVPRSVGGRHGVRAADAGGRAAAAGFTVTQRITVTPLTAAPVDPLCSRLHVRVPSRVSITATGFGSSSKLRVMLGRRPVATLLSDPAGSAAGAFTVPAQTPGVRILTVSDAANGYLRRRAVFSESFSCWSAHSNGSGLAWSWDGVGWDANAPVSLLLATPAGQRVVRRATAGATGSFGILAFATACPAAGTYPVTVSGLSQGRRITIKAGALHIFGVC